MNLQEVVSSRQIIQFSMIASRYMPEVMGHRLAWWLSDLACRIKPAVYHIVADNLRQVLGAGVERRALEQTVREVFYTTVRSQYDLFHVARLAREEMLARIDVPEKARSLVESVFCRGKGGVLVMPHLGSFDLGGQAITALIPEIQVLTLPDPPAGFLLTNALRQRSGAKVTPLSPAALRQAIELLRRGGTVAVAGDRPVSDLDEPFLFFGRPARVPSGHVRLALKTGTSVVVACCYLSQETNRFTAHVEPPLEMIRCPDRAEEVRLNMQRVLAVLEGLIRRWVGQWQMFVPVWPEPLEG